MAHAMGLVTDKVILRNPRLPGLAEVEVDALADSGAVHLCIPDLVIIPKTRTLDVNPESPDIASTIAKDIQGVYGSTGLANRRRDTEASLMERS